MALVLAAACGRSSGADDAWTAAQAESIRSVRGLPVRVRECRGLGRPERERGVVRFARFSCVAGARLPSDRVDTVAVLFELVPLERYRGPASRHRLANVRFLGGPGIP